MRRIVLTEQRHDSGSEGEAGDDEDDLLPRAIMVILVEDELVGLRVGICRWEKAAE